MVRKKKRMSELTLWKRKKKKESFKSLRKQYKVWKSTIYLKT